MKTIPVWPEYELAFPAKSSISVVKTPQPTYNIIKQPESPAYEAHRRMTMRQKKVDDDVSAFLGGVVVEELS